MKKNAGKTAGKKEYAFTEADIVRERDELAQSWAVVAQALGLASPSSARTAYTDLTGRHHSESAPLVKRKVGAPKAAAVKKVAPKLSERNPKWDDDSDQDAIEERLTNRVILVARSTGDTEEIHVKRVTEFEFIGKGKNEHLAVHVTEARTGNRRCFYVAKVMEVR